MSCAACGCRSTQACASVYPRCDVEQDGQGAWSYRCACAKKAGPGPAAGDGADADDVFEALEDLVVATDPTSAAAAQLPAQVQEAIAEAVATFGYAWESQSGDGPTDKLLAAAVAVVNAAEPWRKDWPGQLADVAERIRELAG